MWVGLFPCLCIGWQGKRGAYGGAQSLRIFAWVNQFNMTGQNVVQHGTACSLISSPHGIIIIGRRAANNKIGARR